MKTPLAFPGGLAFQPQAQLTSPPFARVPMPGLLLVPLGETSTPHPPGTKLRQGQSLSRDNLGPPAPSDGLIGDAATVKLTGGREVPAVTFHPGPAHPAPSGDASPDPNPPPDEVWRAGVTARRRTSPDLRAQLASLAEHPVKVIVCNLIDHEPPAALSAALLWHDTPSILAAAQYLRRLCSAERTILAVNHTADPLAESLRRRTDLAGIELIFLPERYPQGDPTLLLYSLLAARLPPAELPTKAGAIVADGPALLALGQYLLRRQVLAEVPVALHDHTAGRLHYLLAPPGTPLRHLLRTIDAPTTPLTVYGGDLMARLECPPEAVLSPCSELILHAAHAQADAIIPSACLRSGWCIEYCPTQVHPAALLEAAQRQDMTLAHDAGLHACIDCGICSYVCPSDLPLAAAIRTLKPDAHDRR